MFHYNQHVGTRFCTWLTSMLQPLVLIKSCPKPPPPGSSAATDHTHQTLQIHLTHRIRQSSFYYCCWGKRETRIQKLKSLDGKIKATNPHSIIDSWAARGLLEHIYIYIFEYVYSVPSIGGRAQGCPGMGGGEIGAADTRTRGRGHENLMIKRNVFVTSRVRQSLIRGGSGLRW